MIGDSKTEEKREWKLIKVHKDMYFLGFFFFFAARPFWSSGSFDPAVLE